jgi:predicted transcriptional regulator
MKRNLTVQLDAETIRKAKILAAQRSMSISKLVAQEIERLVGEEDAYLAAQAEALATLKHGFHLGGGLLPPRDDLHER